MTIAPSSLLSSGPAPVLAVPDLTTPPSAFDPAVFEGMPLNFKMSYLARHGTGTPKEVTMGADAATQRVYREVTGLSGVTGVTIRPPGYHRPPGELTFSAYSNWPDRDQLDYMKRYAVDGAILLADGERMRLSVNGSTLFREPAGFATPPSNLRQGDFDAWPYEARLSYVLRQGTPDVAQTGRLGVRLRYTDNGDVPIYYLKGTSAQDYVLMKRPERFKVQWQPEVTMDQFRGPGWTDDDRQAYLRANGQNVGPYKLVTFGSTAETAILDNGRIYYAPPAFALQNGAINVTADLFASWSPTLQKAYIEKNKSTYNFLLPYPFVRIPLSQNAAIPYREYYLDPRSGREEVKARPASFSKDPQDLTIATFSTGASSSNTSSDDLWTDQDRRDYILLKGAGAMVTIGGTTITTDSRTGSKVYYLNSMTKADFAKMDQADQQRVANEAATNVILKKRLADIGLNPLKSDIDRVLNEATLALDALATTDGKSRDPETNRVRNLIGTSARDSLAVYNTEREIFVQQLNLLKSQVNGGALYDEQAIADRITKIQDNMKRWVAFYPTQRDGDTIKGWPVLTQSATSTNDSLGLARQRLIEQEKVVLKTLLERQSIASSAIFGGKTLDAPTLVFLFQQRYEKQVSASVAADTEELNQINDLLKSYSIMQKVVNRVLGSFDPSRTNDTKGLPDNLDATEMRAVSMFATRIGDPVAYSWEVGSWNHPIANLYLKGSRETYQLLKDATNTTFSTELMPQSFWSNMASSLNSTVTTLNQVAQTKMNDINSVDKQKNRHFDLANGALSKLSEMLQTLGRNIA